jgi:hypothetical protein
VMVGKGERVLGDMAGDMAGEGGRTHDDDIRQVCSR